LYGLRITWFKFLDNGYHCLSCPLRLCRGGAHGVVVVYAQSPTAPSVVIVGYRCRRVRSAYFAVANRHRPITIARARYIVSSVPVIVIVHHKVVRVVSGICTSGIRRRGRRGRRHCREDLRKYTTTLSLRARTQQVTDIRCTNHILS